MSGSVRWESDAEVIALWLQRHPAHTQRAYRHDIDRFLKQVTHPLAEVTVQDLTGFSDSLSGLAVGSRARCLAAVKSLLTFAQKTGHIPINVGAVVKLPIPKDTLEDRILPKIDVWAMIDETGKFRDRVLLRLLYSAAITVSELCALRWKDSKPSSSCGGFIHVSGKNSRLIELRPEIWRSLEVLRSNAADDEPVFQSQKGGGHLHPSQVARIVRAAAKRAGIDLRVSPFWLRHAHATHALADGVSMFAVQQTLGHQSVDTTARYLRVRPLTPSSKEIED